MKRLFAHRITAAFIAAAMLPALSLPVTAEEPAPEAYIHCAAYYDADGRLVSARSMSGTLSADEVDALTDVYEPEGAQTAKVFEWTEELKPLNDSGRGIDISGEPEVVILHTNDMHGALVGSSSIIGADSVAALKKLDKAILADGGDAVQGVALASQSKGEDVIKIMNAAGYDVMAAGNHEFDYGLEQFRKLREAAGFPIISANTYMEDGLLCADGGKNNGQNVIIENDNGVKVGIFALTTQNTRTSTKPENVEGVEFRDEVETAKEQVAALKEDGADVIIAITHMGTVEDGSCTSKQLAAAMKDTGLDAIIDGHSHTVVNETVDGITIAQTGTGGTKVGRMAIDVAEDGTVSVKETMLSRAFFDNVTPDAAVTAVINEANAELEETLKEEIGTAKNTLWGGELINVADGAPIPETRVGESNFGSLICDAMIEEAEKIAPAQYRDASGEVNVPIVAIENGGGYKARIPNGTITRGHIINALPFANTVRIKEITPAILYKALGKYVDAITAQDPETGFLTTKYSGSFPQIGGMRFSYDPNAAEGEKLKNVSLIAGETDLDKNDNTTRLILASNDYVIENGEFTDIPMIAEGSGLTEVVIDYINELTHNGTEPLEMPVNSHRITTDGEYQPKDYTAHITLLNGGGLENGTKLEVYVDGEMYDEAAVLNDGVLDIELPDGPHAVKLFEEQEEVYVNNYSGNGIFDIYQGMKIGYPQLEYDADKVTAAVG